MIDGMLPSGFFAAWIAPQSISLLALPLNLFQRQISDMRYVCNIDKRAYPNGYKNTYFL